MVREYAFEAPAEVTVMTERRVHAPYGLAGGEPGEPGQNWHVDVEGKETKLPGKRTLKVAPGERLRIETPGGGGWGEGLEQCSKKERRESAEERFEFKEVKCRL